MSRFLVAVFLVTALMFPVLAADDPTPSDEAIKEAITVLEARKAQAANKTDQDKIARAITALQGLIAKKEDKKGGDKPEGALNVTPAVLAKKFAGKAAYNPKTGELTLVYDFKNSNQLKDFDLKDTKPALKGGVLRIGPADRIDHVAVFQTGRINGNFVLENLEGQQSLITAGDVSLRYWKFNELWIAVFAQGKEVSKGKFDAKGPWPMPIRFDVTANKTLATIGNKEVGAPVDTEEVGKFSFHGGKGGVRITSLVISGIPNKEWAKAFFAE